MKRLFYNILVTLTIIIFTMNESLFSISSIDGRYSKTTESLSSYFSEAALIKNRVFIEIEYFIALCELPLPQLKDFNINKFDDLRNLYRHFTQQDASEVKDIEKITNHDVKAVEYFIKLQFDKLNLQQYKEFIHFGLTSQDVNNSAIPYALKQAHIEVILPTYYRIADILNIFSSEWKEIPMLAFTHGQVASPTRLGKEIYVFAERLENQFEMLKLIPFSAKFGGATGNFNAHVVAYPEIDWMKFSNEFINNALHLNRLQTTTQIEHYDHLAAYFDNIKRINNILIDLCRDVWTYVSMNYFKQKLNENEVGSSAMPHKVNPIDFENAEGNLGIANALLEHLSSKLPISRLQRDLTDSTVTRTIGVPLAHSLIALKSIEKGLNKLIVNTEIINKDLEDNWVVISEGIQTILRREGYPEPYEALKKLTRDNQKINKTEIHQFIDKLDISENIKKELKLLSPYNYIGVFKM